MTWLTDEQTVSAARERAEKAMMIPLGMASPLWFAFGAAASVGVTWWWMTRWTKAVNLEAMTPLKAAAPIIAVVESASPAEIVAEAAPAPAAKAIIEIAPTPKAAQPAVPARQSRPVEAPIAAPAPTPAPVMEAAKPAPVADRLPFPEPEAATPAAPPLDAAPKAPFAETTPPVDAPKAAAVEIAKAVEAPKAKVASAKRPAPAKATPVAPAQADDLTRLVGIGAKLADALAARGVTQFTQLAAWTSADLAKIDAALNLKGRAVRDSWVAQAKRLASH